MNDLFFLGAVVRKKKKKSKMNCTKAMMICLATLYNLSTGCLYGFWKTCCPKLIIGEHFAKRLF